MILSLLKFMKSKEGTEESGLDIREIQKTIDY